MLSWSDVPAAANALRSALEQFLTDRGVPNSVISPNGRTSVLRLHQRVERFAETSPDLKDHLFAVKWLGNDGTHADATLSRDDLFDAFEQLDHAFEQVFDGTLEKLKRKASEINENKGPRPRQRGATLRQGLPSVSPAAALDGDAPPKHARFAGASVRVGGALAGPATARGGPCAQGCPRCRLRQRQTVLDGVKRARFAGASVRVGRSWFAPATARGGPCAQGCPRCRLQQRRAARPVLNRGEARAQPARGARGARPGRGSPWRPRRRG
ncbi:MAG: DUF4145 domain-containing protein [Polyangiaceae bacterium]|nr:DUF4145 domain-containing protein [Polyangiaceae bacterium]MBK8941804.1 DUF4145 domain-containing protein [Polyangiaceae bacterium]